MFISNTPEDKKQMLEKVGVSSLPDFSPLFPKFPMRGIQKQVPALDREGADLLAVG